MRITNPWIGYLERSYKQVKASLINRLSTEVPEITDYSETNILVIIISMFAGCTEQLNYYIDNLAQECYLSTCRKFSSAYKLTRDLDYRIKSFLAATVDLTFTFIDNDGNPVQITEEALIPSGTLVRTSNNIQFVTLKNVVVPIGTPYAVVSAKQWTRVDDEELGITTNLQWQEYEIPGTYVNNTLEITINDDPWVLQSTLARSLPTDKHFIVDVNENAIPMIKFGNGINGAIPPANFPILGSYYVTEGKAANDISENAINILDSSLVMPDPAINVQVTNPQQPAGGADVETVEDIKRNAPLTIKTLERAVTRDDFKAMLLLADGVAKGEIVYNCGVAIEGYISPFGGGIASEVLLEDTEEFMFNVKVLGRKLNIHPAGITPVVVKATVLSRFRTDKIQVKADVEEALSKRFSFDNQDINGRVALSDVVAEIDNLKNVDTVEIDGLYTLPYPFPIEHDYPLNWQRETLEDSNETAVWQLVYTGSVFRVIYNGEYINDATTNVQYTDPKGLISFKILPASYSTGQTWEFTSYPYNKTIRMTDLTVPVIIGGQTTLIEVI